MKKIITFLLCSFIATLAMNNAALAQITATPQSGCAPLVGVNFTGYAGASNIVWNFGDNTSSSLANPTHTYANPGTYTVTYTASVGGSPVSSNTVVNVFALPNANLYLTSVNKGCRPLSVSFLDVSTGSGSSSIITRLWNYGDGGTQTSTTSTATYNYNAVGSFTPSLTVTDNNGCQATSISDTLVTVSSKPNIITVNTPAGLTTCSPPITCSFNASNSISNSPLTNALTYQWTYLNGQTSNASSLTNLVYSTAGHYTVKLVVTDDNNCSDSISIKVANTSPTYTFTAPDTSCSFVQLTDTLTTYNFNNVNVYYNYGNSTTGTADFVQYGAGGLYTITMHTDSGICHNTHTQQVWIDVPVPNFTFTSSANNCTLPAQIQLTNTSTNSASYNWVFNDSSFVIPYFLRQDYKQYAVVPNVSTATNPIVNITYIDTNQYTINNTQLLDQNVIHTDSVFVTMYATSSFGCTDSIKKLVTKDIYINNAQFTLTPRNGCAPLTVNFTDISWVNGTIATYRWIWGDASAPQTFTTSTATHTYTQPGIYYPKLVIVLANGCIDTSYAQKIEVGVAPNVAFSISPTNVCTGTNVTLTNLTPTTDSVDTYHYYGDNNTISHCTNTANVTWNFAHSVGAQNVTLVGSWRGCVDSVSHPITVKGPIVKLTSSMDCAAPHNFVFDVNALDATGWTINYGDSNIQPLTTATNFTHNYTQSGVYWAKITAFNNSNGCSPAKDSVKVYVRDVHAAIAGQQSGQCFGDTSGFKVDLVNTVGITECSSGYTWLWDDGNSSGPTLTNSDSTNHIFVTNGIHNVKLIVKDENNCHDTVDYNFKIYKTTPTFTSSQSAICTIDTVQFNSTSTSDTTIIAYFWDFGDNTTSTLASPLHNYNFSSSTATSFYVKHKVTNAIGCVVEDSVLFTIANPVANLTLSGSPNVCAGAILNFSLSGNNSFKVVDFDDGTIDTVASNNFTHIYLNAGTYNPSYFVTNSIGCSKSFTSTININVQQKPNAVIVSSIDTASNFCYPLAITFNDQTAGNHTRIWSFGTGAVVPAITVSNTYNAAGSYTTSLIVSTSFGCKDTAYRSFQLYGPVADFNFSPGTICKYDAVLFSIKDTTSVLTYRWDFGDGTDTTAISPISHNYNYHPPSGSTVATLVYWSQDSACVKSKIYPIQIRAVISDFDRNNESSVVDSVHCFGTPDIFTNTSIDASTFIWNFGDGATSSVQNPTHLFSPGDYNVTLAIQNNQYGCKDTLSKKMKINPIPTATVAGGNICLGETVLLKSSGGLTFQWTPSETVSFPNDSVTSAIPTVSTTYTITVSDANDCKDTAQTFVYVQQKPPVFNLDTSVVIGEPIPLITNGGGSFVYTWTPTDSLVCTGCENNISNTLTPITYKVDMKDTMGCFTGQSTFEIDIKPLSSIDVPSAFTPNGDGNNDIVYVRGWGIKKLVYFKIYNRWGELIFETTDINVGWDGTFNGLPLGIEAYAYVAAVETYINETPLEKKGFIKLIR